MREKGGKEGRKGPEGRKRTVGKKRWKKDGSEWENGWDQQIYKAQREIYFLMGSKKIILFLFVWAKKCRKWTRMGTKRCVCGDRMIKKCAEK